MNSYQETVSKFLSALEVDLIKDVKYVERTTQNGTCICGQPIKYCYRFKNIKNNLSCIVGKNCLQYIAKYLGWDDKNNN